MEQEFFNQLASTHKKLSIEILMKAIAAVLMDKKFTRCLKIEVALTNRIFDNSLFLRYPYVEQNLNFYSWMPLHTEKVVDWSIVGKIQAGSLKRNWVWATVWKLIALLGMFGLSGFKWKLKGGKNISRK